MNEKMYCPTCLEKGTNVEGEKLSMMGKVKEHVARKIWESTVLIDPAPIATSPSLVSVLFKTIYKCPVCGGRWVVRSITNPNPFVV